MDYNLNINIIIPCYYKSAIIRPCFESLARQTNKNFIVTMINDCSPNTNCEYQDIRNEFAQYYHIDYYKTEINSGPGIARQIGLNNNKSQYILFIDDDDYLDDNAIEAYWNYLIESNFNKNIAFINGKRKLVNYGNEVQDNHGGFTSLTGSIFNYYYIQQGNIKFTNLIFDEDTLFISEFMFYIEYLSKINGIIYIKNIQNIIYFKIYNQDSLTASQLEEQKIFKNMFNASIEHIKFFLKIPINNYIIKELIQEQFSTIKTLFWYTVSLQKDILETEPLFDLLSKYNITYIEWDESLILPFYITQINTKMTVSKYKEDYLNAKYNYTIYE